MSGKIVHIEWNGPFSIEEAKSKNGKDDKGIYQIYGNHPVYGYGAGGSTRTAIARRWRLRSLSASADRC